MANEPVDGGAGDGAGGGDGPEPPLPGGDARHVVPDIDDALKRLSFLHPKRIDLSLGRVERLLEALGRPHERVPPVIHVAGTNGKGSVVAFMAAMLHAAGQRVHAYTSPHLVRFNERIVLGGKPISDADLISVLERCEAANGGAPITIFEITTAAAFLAFSEHPADVLLLETGLGGRCDATNVIDKPLATVITPVSFDHMEFLGDTLTAIAAEKAAIQKPGVPSLVGRQVGEASEVIRAAAAEVGAPVRESGVDWQVSSEPHRLVIEADGIARSLPAPSLVGEHQFENAGLAIAALEACPSLGVDEAAMGIGLKTARWPARMQLLTRGPLIDILPKPRWQLWLDGGHNDAAGAVVAKQLAAWHGSPIHVIFGMLKNKDARGFLDHLAPYVTDLEAVAIPDEPASMTAEDAAAAAIESGIEASAAPDLEAAVRKIVARGDRHSLRGGRKPGRSRILICGSLYLAGKVLRTHEGGHPRA